MRCLCFVDFVSVSISKKISIVFFIFFSAARVRALGSAFFRFLLLLVHHSKQKSLPFAWREIETAILGLFCAFTLFFSGYLSPCVLVLAESKENYCLFNSFNSFRYF